ncbi:MAG: sulfatase-like hydrolase/transferase [Odoribacter splanchnicus]
MVGELEHKGLLDNSILVITGDHSQNSMRIKKLLGSCSNYSDAQIHVPFIYYEPGQAPRNYHHTTSLRHCADFDAYLFGVRILPEIGAGLSHRQLRPLSPDRYRRKLCLCHPRSDIRKETFRPNRRNGQSAESDRSSDVSSTTQRSFGI